MNRYRLRPIFRTPPVDMGPFHFALPANLTPAALSAIRNGWLVNGYDHTPVPAKKQESSTQYSWIREETESSHLAVAWPNSAGARTIMTATLRPRPEPYQLLIELIRGAVNRVRMFAYELSAVQVQLPLHLASDLASVTRQAGRVILGTNSETEFDGQSVLEAVAKVADDLASLLSEQRFLTRRLRGPLNTRLGCRVSRPLTPEHADLYTSHFNAIRIVPDWAAIEPTEAGFNWSTIDPLVRWANDAGLSISIGPIIDLADGHFPDWLRAWSGDVQTLTAFLTDFVATVVARYRQYCKTWLLMSGFNHFEGLGLSEDDRVKLVARLLETARDVDTNGSWMIGIAQPWGEYLAKPGHAYSPFVLVDTLLRAGFELSGLELELLSGGSARCGPPHDSLDIVQLLESYDTLGVPLHIVSGRGLPDNQIPTILDTCLAAPTVSSLHWDAFDPHDPAALVPGSGLLNSPESLAELKELRERRLG